MDEQIKDKDKLWIVAYICVKGLPRVTAYQRLTEFRNYYRFDKSVNVIVMPVDEPTRIEFYNLEKAEPTSIEKLKELMNYGESKTI